MSDDLERLDHAVIGTLRGMARQGRSPSEMFREANTIGSKASDVEISRHVVEIKSLLERVRELVQNVE